MFKNQLYKYTTPLICVYHNSPYILSSCAYYWLYKIYSLDILCYVGYHTKNIIDIKTVLYAKASYHFVHNFVNERAPAK